MLREFTRLVQSIFPVVDPAASRAFLRAYSGYVPVWPDLWATQLPQHICQGDIVAPVRFIIQEATGDYIEWSGPAMLLSHSCDVDSVNEGDRLLFAACRPFTDYQNLPFAPELKQNGLFSLFYLQNVPKLGDSVVDFNIVQTVQRELFLGAIEDRSIQRASSFTEFGYWWLVAKLTIHLLRPSPVDEVREEAGPNFGTRLAATSREFVAIVRYLFRGRA